MKQKEMFFWNSFAFSMIQQMLAIWLLVPLSLWTQLVHLEVLSSCTLKPGLKDFEHYHASMWNECNCMVCWKCSFALPFFGTGIKTDIFHFCGHCWVFQIWYFECNSLTALSFRILNSSVGIPFPPLALFIVMLAKAHVTWHSRMLVSR